MGEETIALNRRARHEFTIDDSFEAGLVLTGTEIKSIRARKVNLADAYARIDKGEVWLYGMHIAPWETGNRYNHEAKRPRKLLLHRAQITQLLSRTKRSGQGRGRVGPRQAAPRPTAGHRRSRFAAGRRPRAGRHQPGSELTVSGAGTAG